MSKRHSDEEEETQHDTKPEHKHVEPGPYIGEKDQPPVPPGGGDQPPE